MGRQMSAAKEKRVKLTRRQLAIIAQAQKAQVALWRLAEQAAQEHRRRCPRCQGAGQILGVECQCARQQASRNAARAERKSHAAAH